MALVAGVSSQARTRRISASEGRSKRAGLRAASLGAVALFPHHRCRLPAGVRA